MSFIAIRAVFRPVIGRGRKRDEIRHLDQAPLILVCPRAVFDG